MIDLHCHLLPGLDDGPETVGEAVELARLLIADGVHTVVATPHWTPDLDAARFLRKRDQAVAALRDALNSAGVDLKILTGAECRLTDDRLLEIIQTCPRCAAGQYQAGKTNPMLVELPAAIRLSLFEDFLFRAQAADWEIILAHAERHPDIQAAPKALIPLREHGLRVQINAEAVSRFRPWREHRTAIKLLKFRLADILASDAHNCYSRPPYLKQALARATKILGADARRLVVDNPTSIMI